MLIVRAGSATHIGRVRRENQDSCYAANGLYMVADGMGGQVAGGLASRLAVAELISSAEPPRSLETVSRAIARANGRLLEEGLTHPDHLGMGTTLTGVAALAEDRWVVFNVGDSRTYRYLDGTLSQLTVDHSAVQELLDAGLLTPAQALHHPRRNVVTRSLGTEPAPRPDLFVRDPVPGEVLLSCSDGLTNELIDAEIAQVLRDAPEPQAAADELVARAVGAGGHDNVTVVVVTLDGIDRAPGEPVRA
jgi:serine/threonine protein phosphatase PrpC